MNEIKTIESWKNELQTPDHIYDGMLAANDFGAGKQLTQAEYIEAINLFLYGKKKEDRNLDNQVHILLKRSRKKFENAEAINA